MELSILLQHLSAALGLDALALNEDGVLSLEFDQSIVVHLEPDPNHGQCVLYSPLCRAPDDPETRLRLFEALLTANAFGHGTAGVTFSLDETNDDVLLVRTFNAGTTHPDQLLAWMRDLVSIMDIWQFRLHDLLGETSMPSSTHQLSADVLIRV